MQLFGKTIVIISPQRWGEVFVSKQHYAVELAKRENKIYFINPPDDIHSLKLTHKSFSCNVSQNITIVNYKAFMPLFLRYKIRGFYDYLIRLQFKRLIKNLGIFPDVIWNFDLALFSDLSFFKAPITIYHPVDELSGNYQVRLSNSANIVLSVNEHILKKLSASITPKHVIPHGLHRDFVSLAEKKMNSNNITSSRNRENENLRIGYVGNLQMPFLDHKILHEVIAAYPGIRFTFWGPYDVIHNNLSSGNSIASHEFISFLSQQPNVLLRGPLSPEKIALEIQEMDAFLICYKQNEKENSISNSHKIIEYLSTGKVIISTHVSSYVNTELFAMLATNTNEGFRKLFDEVIQNITTYNSSVLQQKRINFALDNAYSKQINRIEELIQNCI